MDAGTVSAWDANCPQHIPQRFEAAWVAAMLAQRDERIETLKAEVERLRGGPQPRPAEGWHRCDLPWYRHP